MDFEEILKKDRVDSKELEILLEAREQEKVEFLLVDIREPFEYQISYILGVDLFYPTSKFEGWIDEIIELAQTTPVILTCRTSNRSYQLQKILKKRGIERVIDHKGGIISWRGKVKKG